MALWECINSVGTDQPPGGQVERFGRVGGGGGNFLS